MRLNDFSRPLARPRHIAKRAFTALEHFLHVEAASGIILLVAAAMALIWANSPLAHSYREFFESPLTIGAAGFLFSQPVHFWINDALMTIFFLVVGMEIRREIHAGSLSDFRQAALPLAAAVGGVTVPAFVYLAVNRSSGMAHGWAVPTATDIAFAVGVLALLGRSIPGNVRVFLLTLAIVDDIIAVLIIAVFYSAQLDYSGFALAGAGIVAVAVMQRLDIGRATAYILPGAVIWTGLFISGVHPTLAGVVLGLMTPVVASRGHERVLVELSEVAYHVKEADVTNTQAFDRLEGPLQTLRVAQRRSSPASRESAVGASSVGCVRHHAAFCACQCGSIARRIGFYWPRHVWRHIRSRAGTRDRQAAWRFSDQLESGQAEALPFAYRDVLAWCQPCCVAGRHRLHDVHLHCVARVPGAAHTGCGEARRTDGLTRCRVRRTRVGTILRLAEPPGTCRFAHMKLPC